MPIYEYACSQCQGIFAVEAKMSDPPPTACENCAGGPIRRIISNTAFVLKGGGWYTTDYSRAKKSGNEDSPANNAATTKPSDAAPTSPTATSKESGSGTPAKADTASKPAAGAAASPSTPSSSGKPPG